MGFLQRLFGKKKEPVVSPQDRAKKATDELNAALKALRKDEDFKTIRPFTTSYNPVTKKRGQLVLGFWNNGEFDVWYQGETL